VRDLTPAETQELVALARELKVPAEWVAALIDIESGWKHTAMNIYNPTTGKVISDWDYRKALPAGYVHYATGLNQMIPSTAKAFGYRGGLDFLKDFPTVISQLRGPVKKFFKYYAPYKSMTDFYVANFWPAARKDTSKSVPAWVRNNNPGFNTFADAGTILQKRIDKNAPAFNRNIAGAFQLVRAT